MWTGKSGNIPERQYRIVMHNILNVLLFAAILGVLIVMHEFGHCLAALRNKVKVEKFSIGFGPVLLKKNIKGIQFSLSLVPLGGYVKLAGDSRDECKGESDEFLNKSVRQRASIIFAGPLLNYVFALVLFWVIFAIGFPMQKNIVGAALPGYPAEAAGIQKGDVIIRINQTPIKYWTELTATVHALREESQVSVTLLRDGQEKTMLLKTKGTMIDNPFEKKKVGIIGVVPSGDVEIIKYSPLAAIVKGTEHTLKISALTVKGLVKLITGKASFKESITGPIGIYYITTQAVKAGILVLLNFLGVLSLSLAIFNCIPFPVLDGGHLLFLLLEKIRGKPLSAKVELRVTQFGMSVLLLLVVFILYNDILRFGPQLWKK